MKYFTLSEAEACIPTVERLMGEARDLKARVDAKAAVWREASDGSAAEKAMTQAQVDFMVSQINSRMDEVARLGCLPKDLEMGLVDFPARMDGREVSLCWRLGETRIDFWHGLEEGFPGRKPLQVPGRTPR